MMGVFLGAQSALNSPTFLPQIPQVDQNDNNNSNESENQMPIGKFTPPSLSASEFTRIAFAFKVLQEGDGFYSETTQYINSMGQVQHVFTKSYRGEGFNLMEEWQHATIAMAKNEFVVYYDDGINVKQKKINNKSKYSTSPYEYDFNFEGQQQSFSSNDFATKYNNINNYPITINPQTSNVNLYDK